MKCKGDFQVGQAFFVAVLLTVMSHAHAAAPMVSNVRASQRPGVKLVDVYYDVADADSPALAVSVAVSTNGGTSYNLPATSFSGAGYGLGVTPGNNRLIVWNAGTDWNGQFSANVRFRITVDDATAPIGMALIPAGNFTMGNTFNGEGDGDELPLHTVYVSAFYIDKYEVTKALWDGVYLWATNHGYSFEHGAQGRLNNHPAHSMAWYDCVKWCNARSEKEGRTPAYYTNAAQTTVYRTGLVNVQNDWVNWNSGYRLPTEAEWEKAARGGAVGHRFPWADTDNVTHSRANYNSATNYAYDTSPTRGYHPTFAVGGQPYTSPVGYFAANGYGLYDMGGNVREWCWDWYGYAAYSNSSQPDPRGPASSPSSTRVFRGGHWRIVAVWCRTASRFSDNPQVRDYGTGFRSVLFASQ